MQSDYRIWRPSKPDAMRTREDYPALRRKKCVSLRRGLLLLKRREGRDAFFDTERFRKALLSYGVSELETEQACLFSRCGGTRRIMSGEELDWTETDRLIANAVQETGLRRDTALKLMRQFALVSGCRIRYGPAQDSARVPTAYPSSLWLSNETLSAFESALETWNPEDGNLAPELMESVERWASAGIPKAQWLLGTYLLRRFAWNPAAGGEKYGAELLRAAMSAGESRAAAELGDYYFRTPSRWKKAFLYYTGYGAPALTKARQKNVAFLLDLKARNERMLRRCAILTTSLLLALLFFHIFPALYPRDAFLDCVAGFTEICFFALSFLRWRFVNPYANSYKRLPLWLLLIAVAYPDIRILTG
ncbi:MAG: hypothetical protein IJQ81_18050 [Oscillibacter sp.]|nr:hypothetical protein [Oscillibacter sp.]